MSVKVGLYVRLEAADGKADEVAGLLASAQSLVEQEDGTTVWYALRFGETTFGIFDAFEGEEGRDAHLSGAVASALGEHAGLFAEAPQIAKVDVLASK